MHSLTLPPTHIPSSKCNLATSMPLNMHKRPGIPPIKPPSPRKATVHRLGIKYWNNSGKSTKFWGICRFKRVSMYLPSRCKLRHHNMIPRVIYRAQWPRSLAKIIGGKNLSRALGKLRVFILRKNNLSLSLGIAWEKLKNCLIMRSPWRRPFMSSRLRLREKEESAWSMRRPSGICRKMKSNCRVNYLVANMKTTRASKGSGSSMISPDLSNSNLKPRTEKSSKDLRNNTDSMSCWESRRTNIWTWRYSTEVWRWSWICLKRRRTMRSTAWWDNSRAGRVKVTKICHTR